MNVFDAYYFIQSQLDTIQNWEELGQNIYL